MTMRARDLRPWKIRLALRMWWLVLYVNSALRWYPLARVVDQLRRPPRRLRRPRLSPYRLSRINDRVLHVGRFRPRCLIRSLVHLRCLRDQGDITELVIGLPQGTASTDAHAWVELEGRVVGPWPGKAGRDELVRYPRQDSQQIGSP